MPNYDGLKIIFDHEITNNTVPSNVISMMNYITASEDNFSAFHAICAFLFYNYTNEFMISIGVNPIEIRLSSNELPKNKVN